MSHKQAAAAASGDIAAESAAATAAAAAAAAATAAADASLVYSPAEAALLHARATLSADCSSVVRSGPGLVLAGLSSFGPLLAVWREPNVGGAAAATGPASRAERGRDVWVGISARGYLIVWSQGTSSSSSGDGSASPDLLSSSNSGVGVLPSDTVLLDFEHFLGDHHYRRLHAATWTMPKLLPSLSSPRRPNGSVTLTAFVMTEEAHGLTYAFEIGALAFDPSNAAADEEKDASASNGPSPTPGRQANATAVQAKLAGEGAQRVGIISHRRLLLRKALYARETPAASSSSSSGGGFAAVGAALQSGLPSRPANVCYHPASNCVLLTVDTDLYAFSDSTLQTQWQANIGPAILGGHRSSGVLGSLTGEEGQLGAESKDSKSAAADAEKKAVAAAAAASAMRMDAKQKRAHAITALTFPSLLQQDRASLVAASIALGAPPPTNAQSAQQNAGSSSSAVVPPFFILGTKSGYLLRLDLRRREALGGTVFKYAPDVRVIARFQEHAVSYNSMAAAAAAAAASTASASTAAAELDLFDFSGSGAITTDQRDELARKKEEERRKRNEQNRGRYATTNSSGGSNTVGSSAGTDSAAGAPLTSSSSSSSHNKPLDNLPPFDPSDLPSDPLLISSPWFDLSASSASASASLGSIKSSAFTTSISSVALAYRKDAWIVAVGCADGFLHIVTRDSNEANRLLSTSAQARADTRAVKYTSSAASSGSHPISFDSAFPSTLLYTLLDPSPHAAARVSPVAAVACSADGACVVSMDSAGVLRRWDLNRRVLAGVAHTEGIVPAATTMTSTGAASSLGSSAASASASTALPSLLPGLPLVKLDLVYPAAHSELAVLYGAGGALAHLGGGAPTAIDRALSKSNAAASASSASGGPSSAASLLASGSLVPSHLQILCGPLFSFWRLQRLPRATARHLPRPASASVGAAGAAGAGTSSNPKLPPSVLASTPSILAELSDFIAAYQAEDRLAEASLQLGATAGRKLRKEKAAAETRAAALKMRESAMGSTAGEHAASSSLGLSGAGSPVPLHASASHSGSGLASTGMLAPANLALLTAGGHHSIAATPNHPGLAEAAVPVEGAGGTGELHSPKSMASFYGFTSADAEAAAEALAASEQEALQATNAVIGAADTMTNKDVSVTVDPGE